MTLLWLGSKLKRSAAASKGNWWRLTAPKRTSSSGTSQEDKLRLWNIFGLGWSGTQQRMISTGMTIQFQFTRIGLQVSRMEMLLSHVVTCTVFPRPNSVGTISVVTYLWELLAKDFPSPVNPKVLVVKNCQQVNDSIKVIWSCVWWNL